MDVNWKEGIYDWAVKDTEETYGDIISYCESRIILEKLSDKKSSYRIQPMIDKGIDITYLGDLNGESSNSGYRIHFEPRKECGIVRIWFPNNNWNSSGMKGNLLREGFKYKLKKFTHVIYEIEVTRDQERILRLLKMFRKHY